MESRFEHRVHSKNPDENHCPVFKPSSGQDIRGTFRKAFAKFPEYKEDPIASKVSAARQELAEKKAKMGPIFHPTSGPKSSRTRPVRFNA